MTPVLLTPLSADVPQVPEFFESTKIRSFWEHMAGLMPTGEGVPVAAFDMMDIYRLVPDIMVCDVDARTCRQRVRFAGTRIASVSRQDATGRYLDEIYVGPYRSQQLAAFSMAVATGRSQWTNVSVAGAAGSLPEQLQNAGACYERLVVPLVADDGSVVQLAAILNFTEDCPSEIEFQHREVVPLSK